MEGEKNEQKQPTIDEMLDRFPDFKAGLARALSLGRFHLTVSFQEKLADTPGDFQHKMLTLNFPRIDIAGCLDHMSGVVADGHAEEFGKWIKGLDPKVRPVAEETLRRLTRMKLLGRVYELLMEKHAAQNDPNRVPASAGKLR